MSPYNGNTGIKCYAIVLFLLLVLCSSSFSQKTILDSTFTFRAGTVKTVNALGLITRQTGYNFTYDSRLINSEEKCELSFADTKLKVILDSILNNNTFVFTVIDKYIIISPPVKTSPEKHDSISSVSSGTITGIIVDEESLEPLAFATIGLKNRGRGTVTNGNGEFGFNITSDLYSDTLYVSYLGYIAREIPVQQVFGSNLTIALKREFISIPEIIIRTQNPQEIVTKARKAIASNFGETPAAMTGFYREGVMRRSELQSYSEAILQIYKSAYSGTLFADQIKVFKSRKIENIDRTDTLAVRLKAGLSTCLDLDGAKNIYDFISAESMQDYTYRMTDIVTNDDEAAYAIEFEQRENVELPLFKGTIFINTEDFGILNAEFEINPAKIDKMKNSFVSSASKGFRTWPVSVKYSVSYRRVNNRYFLSHVRGDLIFASKQKRKLFNTQFKVFFELAITETELVNVTRFDREETAPIHSIFSKTIKNYDPLFWGNQDFLRPEDNLLQELKNMNVRLQEFSK
jgi:hypothetical protein